MRIAYVCPDLGVPLGGTKGASIHVRAVANALADRNHEVHVLAANTGGNLPANTPLRVIDVGYSRGAKGVKKRLRATADSLLAREVYALLLEGRVREELFRLAERGGLDAIYQRHSLWSLASLDVARELRVPIVVEMNAPLVEEQRKYRGLELDEVAAAIEREVLEGASHVVVPSWELESEARKLGARRVSVMPNAVDAPAFLKPRGLPSPQPQLDGRFVVAFVGSLKPWHGVDILLSAFEALLAEVPSAHLLVIGDGPEADSVRGFQELLGVEKVTFTGSQPHESIPSWLAFAHAGVAPYPDLDGFYFSPLKVVEYQAAGLPVVASAVGHLERQIEQEVTGLLTAPGDPVALAGALARLAANRDLAARIGAEARRRVLAEATWGQVAERLEGLFGESTSGAKTPGCRGVSS